MQNNWLRKFSVFLWMLFSHHFSFFSDLFYFVPQEKFFPLHWCEATFPSVFNFLQLFLLRVGEKQLFPSVFSFYNFFSSVLLKSNFLQFSSLWSIFFCNFSPLWSNFVQFPPIVLVWSKFFPSVLVKTISYNFFSLVWFEVSFVQLFCR